MKKKTTHRKNKEIIDKLDKECLDIWKMCVFKRYGEVDVVSGKPANTAHHIIPRAESKYLKFEVENGVPLDHHTTHYRIHYTPNSQLVVDKIRDWCGEKRYRRLLDNAHKQASYNTIEKMLEVKDRLMKELYGNAYVSADEDFIKALKE